MADTHQAAYASVELTREEVFNRMMSVFEAHQIGFTHSVNGLCWDDSFAEFYYHLDPEKKNIKNLRDAWKISSQWMGAGFDFRFSQWDFELYLFTQNQRESVVLSFPHSLYKTATIDGGIASKWVRLLADIGLCLGKTAMICGPEVRILSAEGEELFAQFQHSLKNYRRGDYFIHTVLFPRLLFKKLIPGQQLPETFFISKVVDDYQVATGVVRPLIGTFFNES